MAEALVCSDRRLGGRARAVVDPRRAAAAAAVEQLRARAKSQSARGRSARTGAETRPHRHLGRGRRGHRRARIPDRSAHALGRRARQDAQVGRRHQAGADRAEQRSALDDGRPRRVSAQPAVRAAPVPGRADAELRAHALHVREAVADHLDRRPAAAEGSGSPLVRILGRSLGRRFHLRRQLRRHGRAHVARQRRQPAQRPDESRRALPSRSTRTRWS